MNDLRSGTHESSLVPSPRSRRRPSHMWLEPGANHRWVWKQAVFGLAALAVGLALFVVLSSRSTTQFGLFIASLALWTVLIVTVVIAYRISIPRRLFEFRWSDVTTGIFVGLCLRFLADSLTAQSQGFLAWPSFAASVNELPAFWWLNSILADGLVAPIVEELFFRGFLLVALYTVFRRMTKSPAAAGVAATFISAAVFMLAHAVAASFAVTVAGAVSLVAVGIATAVVTLGTGRIWGAVFAHLTFNGVWVCLAMVGTIVGGAGAVAGLN